MAKASVTSALGSHDIRIRGGSKMKGPVEHQRHFGFELALGGLVPDAWDHTVRSDGWESGQVFRYRWLPLGVELSRVLQHGCDRFIDALCRATSQQ